MPATSRRARATAFLATTAPLVLGCLLAAAAAADPAPFPGTADDWRGFARHRFVAEGQHVLVVEPKQAAAGRPWIWRAEFFDHEPQADLALLAKGWHVVHDADAAGHFGAPAGVAAFTICWQTLTGVHGLAPKPVLEGFSRGGALALNWAIAHPDRVAGLYLDAPLCDLPSIAKRTRNPNELATWNELLRQYGLTDETVLTYDQGPLNRLGPLAAAKVPILLICGDADQVLPYPQQGGALVERYRALGGEVRLILKPGVDHHPHSLQDPTPIVDFALAAFAR